MHTTWAVRAVGISLAFSAMMIQDERVRTKPRVSVESFPDLVILEGRTSLPLMTVVEIEGVWVGWIDGADKDRPGLALRVDKMNGSMVATPFFFVDREVQLASDGVSEDDKRLLASVAKGQRWKAKCFESCLIEWVPNAILPDDVTVPIKPVAHFATRPQITAHVLEIRLLPK